MELTDGRVDDVQDIVNHEWLTELGGPVDDLIDATSRAIEKRDVQGPLGVLGTDDHSRTGGGATPDRARAPDVAEDASR